jgi:hypothetical protein
LSVRVFCLLVFCAALGLRVVAYATADAADPAYIGTWQFTGAVAAPWAGVQYAPVSAAHARLLGKTIVLSAKTVAGPAPFACRAPRYALTNVSAGQLFGGAVGKMRIRDRTSDAVAAGLGFTREPVRTLDTGCAFALHFVNASTAQLGLDGLVYTLKKQ